ncbi:polysaccharide deacetylase family protein [Lacticaseibacillus jixiensis]|uniref:polysaccharide deacetylase family protein n=1 Tax=Lacticaseibacillus jixiensis TaxID=3231926 RepID=UPI0036F25369
MKYYQWVAGLALIGLLAGCHKAQPAVQSQTKPLLKAQRAIFAHSSSTNAGKRIHILMPQTANGKALVKAAPYQAAAAKALGKAKAAAAYVTFTGHPLQADYWQLTPSVQVYQVKNGTTKLVKKQALKPVNVNTKTAEILTAGSLLNTDAELQAVNYRALKQVADGKHLSADQLKQAQAITWLKNRQATNLTVSAKTLTIYPAANPLQIKAVDIPLTAISSYLSKWHQGQATVADAKQKLVALTFDDGPNPQTTPQILNTLAKFHVQATFFLLGEQVAQNPALSAQVAAGHEVGTHTYDHENIAALAPKAAVAEVDQSLATLYEATGKLPTLLRPPYGAMDKAHDAGVALPAIQWSIDSRDWTTTQVAPIVSRVTHATYPGSIILMHDIHPQSVAALPAIIKGLQAQGYRFVTVSQLLGTQLLPHEQYFGVGDHRPIE